MSDPINSFSSRLPINDSSVTEPESTGVPLADALLAGMERGSINKAFINGEALYALHDRSLAQRLAVEGEAGNFTPEPKVLNKPVSSQIPREAVGLSSPELAPDQISSFANAVQIPQAWTEINQKISPLHEKYLAGRNTLADSVMENKLSTLAVLLVTPPLGLAALMNHKSSQQILR